MLVVLTPTTRANTTDCGTLDLISEIQLGQWILAAGGSNAPDAPPPSKTCVKVTVTDTNKESECVFNNYNYTTHNAKIVELVGISDENHKEIYSVAPIHQWLDTEKAYHWHSSEPPPKPEEISFNSMAKSTICWHPATHNFMPYTFTVTAVSLDSILRSPSLSRVYDYIYLVGVSPGLRQSEIHVALLVKEKVSKYEVERMIKKIDNLFTKHKEFPPLTVKCATDYRFK